MDRTSWIAVVVCVALLLGYPVLIQKLYPPVPVDPNAPVAAPAAAPADPASTPAPALPATPAPAVSFTANSLEPKVDPSAPARTAVLRNDFIEVELTSLGAGIRQVALLKHEEDDGRPVILNQGAPLPVFNLSGTDWTGDFDVAAYELTASTPESVTFTRDIRPGLRLHRTFELADAYRLRVLQRIENTTDRAESLGAHRLEVGVGAPVHIRPEERIYIGGAWLAGTDSFTSHKLPEFDSRNFILWKSDGKSLIASTSGEPVRWAAAKSQFFTLMLVSPSDPFLSTELRKVLLPSLQRKPAWVPDGVAVSVLQSGFEVPARTSVLREYEIYAGPKEYSRLKGLPFHQDKIMEFGFLGFIARPLLYIMNAINGVVHNYGLAIILLTILIKGLLWYPQSRANLSMKKMQLLAPKLKELQEKYKDDQQKLQQEMLKLYKDYGVNPLGGCLPLLVQMPIFFALYYMLQSAIELRHESFLWIRDLSQPDTIASLPLGGFDLDINPMPLLMTATMYWTMTITPQPQGVDNPAYKIMKFMPFLMLVFCYNFSSALSLYWTMQNILSAAQMYYNLKQPMPVLEKVASTQPAKKKKRKN
jgi:YidC/Oxa1 family membrane protein insertase